MPPFDPILQNAFVTSPVDGHGETLLWRRASKCPCSLDGGSSRALLACKACGGAGWLYDAPKIIVAIFIVITNQKEYLETGVLQPGDVLMGCAPAEANFISDWDMIQPTWPIGEPFEGDVIVRGDENNPDKLSYAPVKVLNCFTIDATTGVQTFYTQGLDFTISGRFVTWITHLAQGTQYSIKYSTNYEWIVFATPADRFDKGWDIGQKIPLRKRHIILPNS